MDLFSLPLSQPTKPFAKRRRRLEKWPYIPLSVYEPLTKRSDRTMCGGLLLGFLNLQAQRKVQNTHREAVEGRSRLLISIFVDSIGPGIRLAGRQASRVGGEN